MKRVLCIRFPNWPVQCLQHRLRQTAIACSAVALHTALPATASSGAAKTAVDEDTRYLRAIFSAAVTGPAIVAVSPDAWAKGVRPGMPLAEARSMAQPASVVPGRSRPTKTPKTQTQAAVEFHEWQPHEDRHLLKATAELTRRYAPVVGLDAVPMPDSLLLDITGCGPLFGGEAGLAESLLRELRNAGWVCRIAIAQSVAAVWALTHAEIPRRLDSATVTDRRRPHRQIAENVLHDLPIQIIPAGQQLSEISPLPVTASRLTLSDLEILKHLGIRTIGQLLSLPRQDLPSRLSALGVQRIQQLTGVLDESVEPLPEANPVAAAWSSEEAACGLADIRHILMHLSEQIADQLQRRRMACSSVTCNFKCEDESTVLLTGHVVRPTQSADLLHEVLCLRLETAVTLSAMESAGPINENSNASPEAPDKSGMIGQLASLESQPFGHVRMTAVVSPIPVSKQRDLFSPVEHIIPQEELATLITRLSGRLGAKSVLTVRTNADSRPEFSMAANPLLPQDSGTARQAQLDATLRMLTDPGPSPSAAETHSLPSRPLRLLATPQPVARTEGERHYPRRVMVAGKTFELANFSAPERIQTAWWTDQPCHRDYYQVTSHSGSRFWLFRDLHSGQWYLHGIFD